jgi:hypothetical protein
MRAIVFLLLAALWALPFVGCEANPVHEYGTGLLKSREKAATTADAASLQALRQSIQAFRAAEGRYPESVEELAAFSGLELSPQAYAYDPETGAITPR